MKNMMIQASASRYLGLRPFVMMSAIAWILLSGNLVPTEGRGLKGADSKASTKKSLPPLHDASQKGDLEAVQALIGAGADPNALAEKRRLTPLMYATHGGHLEIVKALIAAGANVNIAGKYGRTPLLNSITSHKSARLDIVKVLIAAGADVNAELPYSKSTVLMDAARRGWVEIARELLDAGANVNHKDDLGSTPLLYAYWKGDIAKLLIERGGNMNERDLLGRTALNAAAERGHTELARTLIDAGANLDVQDDRGQTALIEASWFDHIEIVRLLVAAGADVNIVDSFGKTALDRAPGGPPGPHSEEIAAILRKAGAISGEALG